MSVLKKLRKKFLNFIFETNNNKKNGRMRHLSKHEKAYYSKRKKISGTVSRVMNTRLNPLNYFTGIGKKKQLIVYLVLILSVIFFKKFLFIFLFISAGGASKFFQKFIPFVIGVEVSLFFSIISTLIYGVYAGIFVGIGSLFLGAILREGQPADTLLSSMIAFLIMVPVVFHFQISNIFYTQMLGVIVYTIVSSITVLIMRPGCPLTMMNTGTFIATTIPFNYWLFMNFGPFVLSLISA